MTAKLSHSDFPGDLEGAPSRSNKKQQHRTSRLLVANPAKHRHIGALPETENSGVFSCRSADDLEQQSEHVRRSGRSRDRDRPQQRGRESGSVRTSRSSHSRSLSPDVFASSLGTLYGRYGEGGGGEAAGFRSSMTSTTTRKGKRDSKKSAEMDNSTRSSYSAASFDGDRSISRAEGTRGLLESDSGGNNNRQQAEEDELDVMLGAKKCVFQCDLIENNWQPWNNNKKAPAGPAPPPPAPTPTSSKGGKSSKASHRSSGTAAKQQLTGVMDAKMKFDQVRKSRKSSSATSSPSSTSSKTFRRTRSSDGSAPIPGGAPAPLPRARRSQSTDGSTRTRSISATPGKRTTTMRSNKPTKEDGILRTKARMF